MRKERIARWAKRIGFVGLTIAGVGKATYELEVKPSPKECYLSEASFSPEVLDQVMEDIEKLRDSDMAIIFLPGGQGTTLLQDGKGVSEIFEKIGEILEEKGYKPEVLEYQRYEPLWDIVDQTRPSAAAQKTASRISHLTTLKPELKIILVGRSNAAPFMEEVICCLGENTRQVFAIEMGHPFGKGKKPVASEQTLIIAHPKDALAQGDSPSLAKTIFPPHKVDLFGPYHLYNWTLVGAEVKEFLDKNFLNRK
jgi:hypothetical protein